MGTLRGAGRSLAAALAAWATSSSVGMPTAPAAPAAMAVRSRNSLRETPGAEEGSDDMRARP